MSSRAPIRWAATGRFMMLMVRGEVRIGSDDKLEMLEQLVMGNPTKLISLTEQLLQGLSNRDYQKFDEKYIKVVMVSFLFDVNQGIKQDA